MAKIAIQAICMMKEGYGYLGCMTALSLKRAGHDVTIFPAPEYGICHELPTEVRRLIPNDRMHITTRNLAITGGYDINLAITLPVKHLSVRHTPRRPIIENNAPINALETMWEADHLPTQWVEAINHMNCNRIVVPHVWVEEMFKASGINKPIIVLTPGIDKVTYKLARRDGGHDFRFLQMGRMEPRKNIEATLKAFRKAFPITQFPQVKLVVKTRPDAVPKTILNYIQADNRISCMSTDVSEQELVKLFHHCHCFVYPSMGEGFSQPPRNAIATGMPTIVTQWSAMRDVPGAVHVPPAKMVPMPTNSFVCGEESRCKMAYVDPDDLALVMQDVYQNYKQYVEYTIEGGKTALSWQDFPAHFMEVMKG
jgi:glycosyltransferase involved in cell wall biosynthesis